jgi:hypothetical protein
LSRIDLPKALTVFVLFDDSKDARIFCPWASAHRRIGPSRLAALGVELVQSAAGLDVLQLIRLPMT